MTKLSEKVKEAKQAEDQSLQELLQYYKARIGEASQAPRKRSGQPFAAARRRHTRRTFLSFHYEFMMAYS